MPIQPRPKHTHSPTSAQSPTSAPCATQGHNTPSLFRRARRGTTAYYPMLIPMCSQWHQIRRSFRCMQVQLCMREFISKAWLRRRSMFSSVAFGLELQSKSKALQPRQSAKTWRSSIRSSTTSQRLSIMTALRFWRCTPCQPVGMIHWLTGPLPSSQQMGLELISISSKHGTALILATHSRSTLPCKSR